MSNNFIAMLPKFKMEQNPTLLICCDSIGASWLSEKFEMISRDKDIKNFVIGNGDPIYSDNICLLEINIDSGNKSEILKLDNNVYLWKISASDAKRVSEKLKFMCQSNAPGHQYIDIVGGKYRSVVFSSGEYGADVVRKMTGPI